MTYKLEFDRRALKEWEKLGHPVRSQFMVRKLEKRFNNILILIFVLWGDRVACVRGAYDAKMQLLMCF